MRVWRVQAGVSSFYHLDPLGSVRLETQAASPPAFSAKYLPYGNTYATSGAEAFQYTGKQLDVATGLSYYGYRYYDSQSGRFLTVDLAQADYLNPQTLNQYTYALDNPIRFADPFGLMFYDINERGDVVAGGIEAVERTLSDVPGKGESRTQFSTEMNHQIAAQFGSVATTMTSGMTTVTTSWVNTGAQASLTTTTGSQTVTISTSTTTTVTSAPLPYPVRAFPTTTSVVTVSTYATSYTGTVNTAAVDMTYEIAAHIAIAIGGVYFEFNVTGEATLHDVIICGKVGGLPGCPDPTIY